MDEFWHWLIVGIAFGFGFCVAQVLFNALMGLIGGQRAKAPTQQ